MAAGKGSPMAIRSDHVPVRREAPGPADGRARSPMAPEAARGMRDSGG